MKAMITALAAATLIVSAGCTTPAGAGLQTSSDETGASLESILEDQADAWNRGDIDGFMQGYWQSPDLRFASGGTVTRGYDQTLARYKARYTDRAAMGTLSFTDLETVRLSDSAAALHGRWQLERASDAPSGLFTLLFRRFDDGWKIISDTTTSAD